MPPKAVAGWFVAGTGGQLWGVITIAYFRPEAVVQRMAANGRSKLLAVVQLRNTNDCGGPKQSLWVETSAAVCASFLE